MALQKSMKDESKNQRDKMNQPIKILFLAANPEDTMQLRLDEEIREVKQTLLKAEFRDRFDIEQEWAVCVSDLQGHLLRHKPDIVHFSGHGSKASEIILEDNMGGSHKVPDQALSQLFAILKDNIHCVVLNACYSKRQAQAIAEHIDGVIGMSKAIGDEAAINFAIAFYQALGYGQNLKTAFELGCNQINLQNLNEQDSPKLITKRKDPQEMIFVQRNKTDDPSMDLIKEKSGPLVDKIEAEKVVVANKIDTLNM
ncbi:MAG: CHAT domain-containing protein [bacterium]